MRPSFAMSTSVGAALVSKSQRSWWTSWRLQTIAPVSMSSAVTEVTTGRSERVRRRRRSWGSGEETGM